MQKYEILGRDNLNILPKKLLHIPIKMQCRAGGTGEARGAVAPPKFSRISIVMACLALKALKLY